MILKTAICAVVKVRRKVSGFGLMDGIMAMLIEAAVSFIGGEACVY